MSPKISVIIPFYNGANSLHRAVESVLNQNFEDWELILVNDGSTDESSTVAKRYLSDSRIQYLDQENKGVSAARNCGAEAASAAWLIFLDADDELSLNCLSTFSARVEDEIDLISSGIKRISGHKEIIKLPQKGKYFSRISGTFLIRRVFFLTIGGYDSNLKFAENTELFHRIRLNKGQEEVIAFVSLNYYENEAGGSKNLRNMISSLNYFMEKHQSTLSTHVKFLYHQIIGVNHLRFQEYKEARFHLNKALQIKPNFGTLARWFIACLPFMAKKLYPEAVSYK
ncbi:glycosyltransferase family A protein [Algoriphagus sp.]|uniref:glycosyltransferase family 2 protein n=1 Tax=Algoriphagus sp. TaxID=1872435 RepID=UPI00327A00D1